MHIRSAVLHQDSPCAEFWHDLLRPYEHYVPLRRDLADLRAQLRYLRSHDDDAERMAGRMRRLANVLLSQEAVAGYARELLAQHAALRVGPVRLHEEAVRL